MIPVSFRDALTEEEFKLVKSPIGYTFESKANGKYLIEPQRNANDATNLLFEVLDTWRICCIEWKELQWCGI